MNSINKILSKKKKDFDDRILKLDEDNIEFSSSVIIKQNCLKGDQTQNVIGDESSIERVSKYENVMLEYRKGFKAQADKYESILEEFSENLSSGLNYLDRYKSMKEMYWEDLKELFRKVKSLYVGLSGVYGIHEPLPSFKEPSFLNELYLWQKSVMLQLSKLLESEQETTVVISLRNGFSDTSGGRFSFFTQEDFDRQLVKGVLEFSIPEVADDMNSPFSNRHRPRLRSISVFVNANEYDIWNLRIKIPNPYSNHYTPDLFISANSPSINSKFEFEFKSLSYFNLSPIGVWEIFFPDYSSAGTNRISSYNPDRSVIDNVFLVLKLSLIN